MRPGTVEPLPSGRFRARLSTADGRRPTLGTYATEHEARAILDAAMVEVQARNLAPVGGVTLRKYAERWLDRREHDGVRDVQTERYRWALHLDTAPFAGDPVASLTRHEIVAWVDAMRRKHATHYGEDLGRALSRESVKKCLALLRRCLKSAVLEGVVRENVADHVELWRADRTHEAWTYLEPHEQAKLTEGPEPDRFIVAFALGTGLRQGEQWNLELRDLVVDGDRPHVVVRYGSKGKTTKSGKTRRVPLFGLGLDAAVRWLALLPAFAPKNPLRLAFPTERGARRQRSKTPKGWPELVASLGRHVRWHDLRHTCASSLVAGWWGRAWRLDEVKAMLGHSSVTVTERYAHLGDTALSAAAAATVHDASKRAVSAENNSETLGPYKPDGAGSSPAPPTSLKRLRNEHLGHANGPTRGRIVDPAALLEAIAANRADEADALALVDAVLARPEVALALACADVGPLFWGRVVSLCERLVAADADELAKMGGAP